jgi:hypothetical protein
MYVDGVPQPVAEVQCSGADATGLFPCSGRLPSMTPGRHTLELAAVRNGMESARSEPLLVQLMALEAPLAVAPPDASGRMRNVSTCGGGDCFDVSVLAQSAGSITWPLTTPDGRLFFVDGDRTIRTVENDTLLDEPALALDTPGARIVGLAADPDYERSRHVYVSWSSERAEGIHELQVTRYREVQNVFGEPSTIVSGIDVPADALAPIAVDSIGTFFLAVPAPADGQARRDTYAGFVLRFAADGRSASGRSSPVVAYGFENPSGIAIDPLGTRVWLAGSRAGWTFSVASVAAQPAADAPWPLRPTPSPQGSNHDTPFVTFARSPGATQPLLHIVAPPGVTRVGMTTETVRFSSIGEPLAMAQATQPVTYFVTGTESGGRLLLRLAPR